MYPQYSEKAVLIIAKFIKFLFSDEINSKIEFDNKPSYSIGSLNKDYNEYQILEKELLSKLKDNDEIIEAIQNIKEFKKKLEIEVKFKFSFEGHTYSVNIYENKIEQNFSFSFYLADEKYYDHNSKNLMASFFNSGRFACISNSFIEFIYKFEDFYKTVQPEVEEINNNSFMYSETFIHQSLDKFNSWKKFLSKRKSLKKYVYNDLDNSAFFKSNENYEMIVHEDQSLIFCHILNKKNGEFKIFDCSHLKENQFLNFNPDYFMDNFEDESEYLAFYSLKGLNIKCSISFFIKEHLYLLRYGLK